MLSLKPEDEKRLHPEALKWFNAWRAEVQFDVPLEELTDDDLNSFLSDDEKHEFIRYRNEIIKGLVKCTDIPEASNDPLISATFGLSLLKFQVDSLLPMRRIRLLLKDVHQRKIVKAKQEQRERDEEDKRSREQAEAEHRRKEEEERWQAARKAVSPPLSDAKRYLDDEEYDKFKQAALKAIEVYLEKSEDYLDDMRTFDYRWYLKNINDRKEKEKQKTAANIAAREYNQRLNKEKERLKALMCPTRKDHESYFKKQIEDRRYTGQSFASFLTSEEEQDFDETIVDISRKKLDEVVSSDFRQFIDSKYWRSCFLLPSAEYSLEGVPGLDFMFDVFAVVETRVWLKPGEKIFGDHVFKLPWREEKGSSVLLQEPEFLGYYYLVLTPEELGGYMFWQSIPLVLLRGLLSGEIKHSGVTISAASDDMITYKIPKFKEEVYIPDNFAGYLKGIGGIDEMAGIGIITQKVARITKSEMGELKIEREALALEEKTKGKDTKKAKAFHLFSQGKGPSSPEVKVLGLHKSTRFKYYNQYLEVHKQ